MHTLDHTPSTTQDSSSKYYAIQHALLASLPVNQCITTNYDQLFERARAAAGSPIAVIPRPTNGVESSDSWLLKMHGCVSRPQDIVLSRDDYLEYDSGRAALAGVVQAMLLTKHLLYVGFSLTDYNFHKIVSAVKRALPESSQDGRSRFNEQFGSALMLQNKKMETELWKKTVELIPMIEPDPSNEWKLIGFAARQLEIFLDIVSCRTVDSSAYLLDNRYHHMLTTPDTELARFLLHMLHTAPDKAKDTGAWGDFQNLIRSLGGSPEAKVIEQDDPFPTAPVIGRQRSANEVDGREALIAHPAAPDLTPNPLLGVPEDHVREAADKAGTPSENTSSPPSSHSNDPVSFDRYAPHVFVARADLRILSCDAWLTPSQSGFSLNSNWIRPVSLCHHFAGIRGRPFSRVPNEEAYLNVTVNGAASEWERVAQVPLYPEDRATPFLTSVVSRDMHITLDAVQQFFAVAHRFLQDRPPRNGRSKHLLAVPVIGTGAGGLRSQTGRVIPALLKVLRLGASKYNVDVVLVCWDAPSYSIAQIARLRLFEEEEQQRERKANNTTEKGTRGGQEEQETRTSSTSVEQVRETEEEKRMSGFKSKEKKGVIADTNPSIPLLPQWLGLTLSQKQEAERCAGLASSGRLSMFLGECVLSDSHLSLSAVLLDIARACAAISTREIAFFESLPLPELIRFIEKKVGGKEKLHTKVSERLRSDEVSLLAAFVAVCPCDEYITSSPDEALEQASKALSKRLAVLPHHPNRDAGQWYVFHYCVVGLNYSLASFFLSFFFSLSFLPSLSLSLSLFPFVCVSLCLCNTLVI